MNRQDINSNLSGTDCTTAVQGERGMILQLADGTIAACNAAAQTILGLTIEQLQEASSTNCPWQTIHPDGTPFPGNTHPAVIALSTGQPCIDVEMGFYKPSGELVWLSLEAQPLFRREATTPYAVTVTITQIAAPRTEASAVAGVMSASRQSEETQASFSEADATQSALETALQRLNFHVENTPLAVIEWDQNFRINRWSSEAERIFG